jgi:hypothetical protein
LQCYKWSVQSTVAALQLPTMMPERKDQSDRDFGQRGIDAALNVKTTAMTRSEQITD